MNPGSDHQDGFGGAAWSGLRIALLVALLAAGIVAKNGFGPVGRDDRPWALPDLDGRPHNLNDWQGRVVVLHFWATWCANCVEEWGELNAAQQALGPAGLQIVGAALDEDAGALKAFLAGHPADYPILFGADHGSLLSERLGNREQLLPFTVIFDRHGHPVFSQIGRFSRDELAAIVSPLLR